MSLDTSTTRPYELLSATYCDTGTAWGWLSREQRYLPLAWGAATSHNGTITTWTSPNPTTARLIAQITLHRHQATVAAAALPILAAAAYFTLGPIAAGLLCALGIALAVALSTMATAVTSTTLTDRDVILATLLALHPTHPQPTALPAEIFASLGETIITRHRPDGTVFRPRTQSDRDAVASLLYSMADAYAQGRTSLAEVTEIVDHLPERTN